MATTFGGQTLYTESISISLRPHKAKQTLGKRCTQHEIIGADTNDTVLDMKCYISSASTSALQTARDAIEALNDGKQHAYADSIDSHYDGNYVIETSSIAWDTHINPTFIRYSLRLVEW